MQKREEKKQLILSAATECFSQNGYDKTTLDDIGSKVSLNKATLYYYYSSKDDLFCDVIYSEAQHFRELVRVGINTKKGIEEKIVFLLIERTKFYKRLGYLRDLIVSQGRKIEPIFISLRESIYKEERNLMIGIIQESMELGEIRYSDTNRLADVFLRITNMDVSNRQEDVSISPSGWKVGHPEADLEDIRFTTRLIVSGISPRA